jgi:cytoskeletal protein CcmA (bactofilin family)
MRQTDEEWDRQVPAQPGEESVIGGHDFFNGAYRSERGVRVQGRVEGSIESKGHIYIEQSAQVVADLTAQDITVAGRYNGKVECRRRFEITPTGVVTGDINTDLLVVHEGGYFDGKLKMKDRPGGARVPQLGHVVAARAGRDTESDQAPAQV